MSSRNDQQKLLVLIADDGLATEDDEDETVLLPAEMHSEPASTAVAAQNAAKAVATVKAEEQKEHERLEEDAIGMKHVLVTLLCVRLLCVIRVKPATCKCLAYIYTHTILNVYSIILQFHCSVPGMFQAH